MYAEENAEIPRKDSSCLFYPEVLFVVFWIARVCIKYP